MSKPLHFKRWYHGNISRTKAEMRLKLGCDDVPNPNGTYLVYDRVKAKGEYNLIVMMYGKIYRWILSRRKSDGRYAFEDCECGHPTVVDMIKAHRGVTGKPFRTSDGFMIKLSRSYVYCEDD